MGSIVKRLTERQLVRPPSFVPENIHYETLMGSMAYGVSTDSSDNDVYGFCIPPKEIVFPHLAGEILGFGRSRRRFDQFQQHHIQDDDAAGGHGKSYDVTIYNIVRYFQLAMENNPNMVDSLFTPRNCVLHSTPVGEMVRDRRRIFLHKGCWNKFKGYAFGQLSKMKSQSREGNRKEIVEKFGFDVKFAYHVIRLIDEVEQILTLGDLDLTRAREHMKAVRKGEVPLEEIVKWFNDKERQLENVYHESTLPAKPRENEIKQLLLDCLEQHYGSLDGAIVRSGAAVAVLRQVEELARDYLMKVDTGPENE